MFEIVIINKEEIPEMNSNIEKLREIPYSIINDKALAHQDFLYKLIIIGDTGKHYLKVR